MQGLILVLQMLAVLGLVCAGVGIFYRAKLQKREMVLMITIGLLVAVACLGVSYLCVRPL